MASESRQWLLSALRDRGFQPCESSANFVYLRIREAGSIAAAMRNDGVAVRSFADPSALRITVGPVPMMDAALAAFDRARRSCA
jgi:histidinol-phosphate/aromatic aminotransferase/cobyric acid decarboxylase-like protein